MARMATDNKPPYEYEDVIAILIEGMNEFTYIHKGSLKDDLSIINGAEQLTVTATDQYDNSKIFVFAHRIVAVKYEPENLSVVAGGVTHLSRPLP